MQKKILKEQHRVIILCKRYHTDTLVSAQVRSLSSHDTFSIKLEGFNNVNFFTEHINKGDIMLVEGYMHPSKSYGEELAVVSFEVQSNQKNVFVPSEKAKCLFVQPKKKANN